MKQLYKTLLFTSFLLSFSTTAFAIFIPLYFDEIGLSYVQIGLVLGLLNIAGGVMSLYVGYLEEKVDRIRILIASYFGYSMLPLLYLGVGGFISALLVSLYDGLISAVRYLSKYSILESRKAYETGVNVATNESLTNLGSLLGPLAAGFLVLHFGIESIFFMAFFMLLPLAFSSLRMLKYSKVKFNKKARFTSLLGKAFHNRSLLMLSFLYLLFIMVDSSKFLAMTLYMKASGFDEFLIAVVGSSFFFFMFLFEMFSGRLERDGIRKKFLTTGLLLCALTLYMFSAVPAEFDYFMLLALLFSLGTALVRPAIYSELVISQKSHSNIATGVLMFFAYIGAVIGLVVTGVLIDISFTSFFIFGAAVLLIASVLTATRFVTSD
jgi:MFS family permease